MIDDASGQQENPPQLKFELMKPDSLDKYLLRSRKEIVLTLRALREKRALITVYFNQGDDFLLTTLIAIEGDSDALIFDIGSDADMNRKALACRDKLFFVTSLDKVKIQFSVSRLEKTRFEGHPAFRAPLPDTFLRLQRREYYRLTIPISNPLKCCIPFKQADGTETTVETIVYDISCGGLAVMAPPEGVGFEVDRLFENCRIDLPHIGTITATLQVRNVFEVTQRNGARVKRAGCQFEDMPGHMRTLIQRYITRIERERQAKETGLT